VRDYSIIARGIKVRIIIIRIIYIIVLRAGTCADIIPLVVTGILDYFQFSFNLMDLYYYI